MSAKHFTPPLRLGPYGGPPPTQAPITLPPWSHDLVDHGPPQSNYPELNTPAPQAPVSRLPSTSLEPPHDNATEAWIIVLSVVGGLVACTSALVCMAYCMSRLAALDEPYLTPKVHPAPDSSCLHRAELPHLLRTHVQPANAWIDLKNDVNRMSTSSLSSPPTTTPSTRSSQSSVSLPPTTVPSVRSSCSSPQSIVQNYSHPAPPSCPCTGRDFSNSTSQGSRHSSPRPSRQSVQSSNEWEQARCPRKAKHGSRLVLPGEAPIRSSPSVSRSPSPRTDCNKSRPTHVNSSPRCSSLAY